MPYTQFPPRAEQLSALNWYSLRDISKFVANARAINWSVGTERQAVLDALRALPSKELFAHDRRFPEHGAYLHFGMCSFGTFLTNMESSLAYKESAKHRNSPKGEPERASGGIARVLQGHDQHIEGTITSFSSFDDAMLNYYNSLKSIQGLLVREECSYTRATLEDLLGLAWG